MEFIFCEQYINTNTDFKQVEHDIYDVFLDFHGLHRKGYEDWKGHLECFSRLSSDFKAKLLLCSIEVHYRNLYLVHKHLYISPYLALIVNSSSCIIYSASSI